MKWLKLLGVIAFGIYVIRGAFNPCGLWLFNGADLLFHEAGHLIFGIFGQFIGICGGTIGQLLFPIIAIVYFLAKREKYSAAFGFFWAGVNCFQIAAYIKDARSQVLPLVGGDIHDWEYILGRLGLIQWDQQIGGGVWWIGLLVVIFALFWGMFFSFQSSGDSVNETATE